MWSVSCTITSNFLGCKFKKEELLVGFKFLSFPPSLWYCEMLPSTLVKVLLVVQIAGGILEGNLTAMLSVFYEK